MRNHTKVLITGGAGFLGRAIVDELLRPAAALPVDEVRCFDIAPAAPVDPRVAPVRGDVCDPAALVEACRGVDAVFHCAALVDWGRIPEERIVAVNEAGTRNVVEACRQAGVRALIHTSTLDVLYTGHPVLDGDETLPLPDRHADSYGRSKAAAERIVLAADDTPWAAGDGRLRTTVIRPMSIWGEDDPYHIGSLLELTRRFPLVRIGRQGARSSFVYVRNCAHGEVLAARSLLSGDPRTAGQVYFIGDAPPRNLFDLFEPVLRAAGRRVLPPALALPQAPVCALAGVVEDGARALRPWLKLTPTLTRFAVNYVCLDFSFRWDKAARELGYTPRFTEAEALARTADWYRARAGVSAR